MVLGGYTITRKGVAGFDLRDSYHLVIALSWPRFIVLVVAVHPAINVGFALLYLAQPAAIANAHRGSLADAFFFSVETSATVGYGEMYPATLYGHIVCTTEIFVGVAFTALATGLLFVRFSRAEGAYPLRGARRDRKARRAADVDDPNREWAPRVALRCLRQPLIRRHSRR